MTGNVGGGTWFVSSHSKNLKAAEKFAEFVTTADDYQVELAPGLPRLRAGRRKWIAKQESSGYYATDLQPVVTAGTQIWTGWGSGVFSQEADLGQDDDPGDRRRQEPGRPAADVADGDQEPGPGRRLHGQLTVIARRRPRAAGVPTRRRLGRRAAHGGARRRA